MTEEVLNSVAIPHIPLWLVIIGIVWVIAWKGVALWKAARLSHKKWFIVLIVINTLGILEIIYIFAVARKYTVETVERVEEK